MGSCIIHHLQRLLYIFLTLANVTDGSSMLEPLVKSGRNNLTCRVTETEIFPLMARSMWPGGGLTNKIHI